MPPGTAINQPKPPKLDCSVLGSARRICHGEDRTFGPDPVTNGGALLEEARPTSHSAGEDAHSVMDTYAGAAVRVRPPSRR